MYVQAFPGGPGGEGISSAYVDYFDERILEHFDLVYSAQRGLGLSSPLDCPVANASGTPDFLTDYDTSGVEGLETPDEQQEAIDDTRKFVNDCGMNRVCISTGVSNVPAKQLYDSIGFKTVNRYLDYVKLREKKKAA